MADNHTSSISGPKLVLRGEPDLFDLPAWQQRLKDLEGDEPSEYRDILIDDTKAHLQAIGGHSA